MRIYLFTVVKVKFDEKVVNHMFKRICVTVYIFDAES